MRAIGHYIGGRHVAGTSGRFADVYNPSVGAVQVRAALASRFGGDKNHALILPDADLDQTVDALIGAGYGSACERCMAI
jgi:acyl-CoA reductase-like NAD-dependent aldehyde dehydrogenase